METDETESRTQEAFLTKFKQVVLAIPSRPVPVADRRISLGVLELIIAMLPGVHELRRRGRVFLYDIELLQWASVLDCLCSTV